MQHNALAMHALATTTLLLVLGNCWHTNAYVVLPAAGTAAVAGGVASNSDTASDIQRALNEVGLGEKSLTKHMAELMTGSYPERTATSSGTGYVMNDISGNGATTHQMMNELNGRAAVYDPGDELLRALNAEMVANGQELGTLPEEPDYADTVFNKLEVANKYEILRELENELRTEQAMVTKSALLVKMLEDPNLQTLPIIYVEDEEEYSDEDADGNSLNNLAYGFGGGARAGNGVAKRSRYYRRFPWKRHNKNRSQYDPELRYACTPSKEDVLKLLKILHENQKGNHNKTVNFCNRKRPAKVIFTNIRFLG